MLRITLPSALVVAMLDTSTQAITITRISDYEAPPALEQAEIALVPDQVDPYEAA